MDKKEKLRLKKQLEQQAGLLASENDDGALAASILTTCGALLRTARKVLPAPVPEQDFDAVYAGYLSISGSVDRFAQDNQTRLAGAQESEEQLKGQLAALNFQRDTYNDSIAQTRTAIQKEEQAVAQKNRELNELSRQHAEVLSRKNEAEKAKQDKQKEIHSAENEIRSYEEQVRSLDSQLERLTRAAAQAKQNYEDLPSYGEEVKRIREGMAEEGYVDMEAFTREVEKLNEQSEQFVQAYDRILSGLMKDMEDLQDKVEDRRKRTL